MQVLYSEYYLHIDWKVLCNLLKNVSLKYKILKFLYRHRKQIMLEVGVTISLILAQITGAPTIFFIKLRICVSKIPKYQK